VTRDGRPRSEASDPAARAGRRTREEGQYCAATSLYVPIPHTREAARTWSAKAPSCTEGAIPRPPPPPTTHTHAFEAVLDDATCGLLARPPRKPLAGPSTALINTQPSAKFILEVSQKKPPLKPAAHLKVTGPVDQLEASLGSTQQRWRATRAPEAVGQSPPALYTKARQQEKLVPSKGSSASRSRTPVFCVPAASGRGCGSSPPYPLYR